MNLLIGSKDTDFSFLLYVDDKDLINVCLVNKAIYALVKSEEFWRLKTLLKLEEEKIKIEKPKDWKQFYIEELAPISLSKPTKFIYDKISIDKYDIYNKEDIYVKSVLFYISNSEHRHTLRFYRNHTVKEAIKKVEIYLSQPITSEYLDKIKDDIDVSPETLTMRGSALNQGKLRGMGLNSKKQLVII